MKIEVKWIGGRLMPFAKDVPFGLTPIEAAKWYINEVSKADYFAFGYVEVGARRLKKPGSVSVALYPRQRVLNALERMEREGSNSFGVLSIIEGQVKVTGLEAGRVKPTFGNPDAPSVGAKLFPTNLTKKSDLKPDAGCPNAPYARAWEKVVAKAVKGQWVGGLKNVQVDVIVNDLDD